MSSKRKLGKSRDGWKKKAMDRGEEARYQRKENARVKRERDQYKQKFKATMMVLEEATSKKNFP